MTIWFTSDLHLGHGNIIKYCNRPFANLSHMNSELTLMFSVCKPGDKVYILGDIGFGKTFAEPFFKHLNFLDLDVYTIVGNHDHSKIRKLMKEHTTFLGNMHSIVIEDKYIVLTHFPMHEWDNSHWNSWNLHGHSHKLHKPVGKQHDVGVDNNHFRLINFNQLKKIIDPLPDNPNYLTKNDDKNHLLNKFI